MPANVNCKLGDKEGEVLLWRECYCLMLWRTAGMQEVGSRRGLCWQVVPKPCMVPAGAVLRAQGGCSGLWSGPTVGCLCWNRSSCKTQLKSPWREVFVVRVAANFAKLLQRAALNVLIYSQRLS